MKAFTALYTNKMTKAAIKYGPTMMSRLKAARMMAMMTKMIKPAASLMRKGRLPTDV